MVKTFDRNCGQSAMLRASCIRNLFHQDRWWMENSVATSWGNWGTTSGTNVQTSGAKTPGSRIMKTLWHMHCLLCSSFWLLWIWVIPHPPYSLDIAPCDFFLFPKMKLKIKGWHFDSIEEIQTKLQNVMKTLTENDSEVLLITEVPLESPYQYQRGLLWRGWGK